MPRTMYFVACRSLRQRVTQATPPKWIQQSSLISTSAAPFSTHPQTDQEENNRSIWSKLLLFIPGAITFGLGTWQIFRRQDKIKMLDYRQSRLAIVPLKGNEIVASTQSMDSLEFRKVQCKGVFDEKKSIYIGPRSRSISGVTENGYYVITPLIPVPGDPESVQSPILVNRGWVPRSWRDKALDTSKDEPLNSSMSTSTQESTKTSWWRLWSIKNEALKENVPAVVPVEVIGVVRGNEKPSIFVPSNDPNASQWFYVDVPELARACGLPESTLYIEEINEHVNARSPYPIQKDHNMLIRTSRMPQDHLNYILTWYSLSAAVTFMAIKRLKPRKSGR
ncbi:Surfeit locus 1 cytochrome c oxidase biogenesis protein [Perilla frutescens var. hirtella]|uniref:SURF1-like protein n=1 Tax=Perilla frutescens var. hirtella TaxID=608512 RepID=A0AAD4JIG8_PERFH|nr:Surfeit locus 1 cytochrome c oxidase biogenesis protein [Perilla frutescens var. hirtella]KAH6815052.1 Surfeit locus 1 cytochrome c oxidase biogenesis protein [Perilla frutescens var. frutescens]KAH6834463.1 Surfeit locus 1 cytochrome c oxidase biogenesis protein [Perilla frutescens var. hirtella]